MDTYRSLEDVLDFFKASSYNLYSAASDQSKVVTTIHADNQGEYIRFYTDKDGKWAKYANSSTGDVGWGVYRYSSIVAVGLVFYDR